MIAVMMMTIHSQGEEDTAEPGDEVSNEVAAWSSEDGDSDHAAGAGAAGGGARAMAM